MKKIFCFFVLLVSQNIYAEVCFNASEISKNAPYVAAPDIEKAIVTSANNLGWNVDNQAAKTASYAIVGHLGIVQNDDLMVCIKLNGDGQLVYQSFPSKMGKDAPIKPLKGSKK